MGGMRTGNLIESTRWLKWSCIKAGLILSKKVAVISPILLPELELKPQQQNKSSCNKTGSPRLNAGVALEAAWKMATCTEMAFEQQVE